MTTTPQLARAHKSWTRAENTRLEQLVEAGKTFAEIATALKRSKASIRTRTSLRKIGPLTTADLHSATSVCRMIGLAPYSRHIQRWIKDGILPATVVRCRGRMRFYRITDEAIDALLADPHSWPFWQPEQLRDPVRREWTTALRATQPGWLTTTEVARRLGVAEPTVQHWVSHAQMQGTVMHKLYIRESDLDAFVLPCERPRGKQAA